MGKRSRRDVAQIADISTELKSNRKISSANSEVNALSFLVDSILSGVNTALPVQITAVNAGGSGASAGYVTVKPLVSQIDAGGNTIDPTNIFQLPYSRIQGGVAALVIDPVVGDIGLAVFAQRDCSNVGQEASKPVQPGSFRTFSQSDGFYVGGFLNKAPTVFVEVKQDNTVTITASGGVTINAPTVTVPSGDVTASGVSLLHHTHSGVDSGSSNTGQPNS